MANERDENSGDLKPMTVLQPIETTNRDFVGSLEKGLRVLRSFNDGEERMTLSEVAKLSGLPRAGARRLLLTLHALGYVKSDSKYYQLSVFNLTCLFSLSFDG